MKFLGDENLFDPIIDYLKCYGPAHFAQAINYLEAFRLKICLLINFGAKSLEFRRLENKKIGERKSP